MPRKAKYPIVHQPSPVFMERLKQEQDPIWVIEDLKFEEIVRGHFKAQFMMSKKGKGYRMEMNIGGHQERTMQAIEDRVINALKPGGKL